MNAAFHCCKLNETVLVDILIGKFMDDDIKLQSDTKIRDSLRIRVVFYTARW